MIGSINSARVNRLAVDSGFPAISTLEMVQAQLEQLISAVGVSVLSASVSIAQAGDTIVSVAAPFISATLDVIEAGNAAIAALAVSGVFGSLSTVQGANTIVVLSKTRMGNHLYKSTITDHSNAGTINRHTAAKRTFLRH